jgi:antitoxin VapB
LEGRRFDTDEVRTRRHGAGVILEPIAFDWPWLDAMDGSAGEDFFAALEEPSPSGSGLRLDSPP